MGVGSERGSVGDWCVHFVNETVLIEDGEDNVLERCLNWEAVQCCVKWRLVVNTKEPICNSERNRVYSLRLTKLTDNRNAKICDAQINLYNMESDILYPSHQDNASLSL